MTIQEELAQEIESTPEALLVEVLDFLRFIKAKQSLHPSAVPASASAAGSTGRSLLDHLQTIGNWAGEDFEDCLQSVYTTRSPARFDGETSPFE